MLVHVSASDKPRLDRAGQLLKLCFPKFPASFWPRHVQSSNTVLYVADDTLADAIGGDADASKAVMNPILLEQHISEPTILDDAPATSVRLCALPSCVRVTVSCGAGRRGRRI